MKELLELKDELIKLAMKCDTDTMVALARINREIDKQIEKLK
jgi:hypothetical protein